MAAKRPWDVFALDFAVPDAFDAEEPPKPTPNDGDTEETGPDDAKLVDEIMALRDTMLKKKPSGDKQLRDIIININKQDRDSVPLLQSFFSIHTCDSLFNNPITDPLRLVAVSTMMGQAAVAVLLRCLGPHTKDGLDVATFYDLFKAHGAQVVEPQVLVALRKMSDADKLAERTTKNLEDVEGESASQDPGL